MDPPFICFFYWDDLFPPEAQEVEPSKFLLLKSVGSVLQQSLSEGLWVDCGFSRRRPAGARCEFNYLLVCFKCSAASGSPEERVLLCECHFL